MSANENTGLTPSQQVSIWTGVSGVVLGCSAWMLAMAAMGKDWMALGVTIAFDGIMLILFARLCLQKGAKRLLLLATLMMLVTAHCISMYWWRFDLWRGGAGISAEALQREKLVVTFTISAMVGLLLAQIGIFYLLKARSRKNRLRTLQN
jgi:hypothetical protein